MDKTQFLQNELNRPGKESKKWRMTVIGLLGIGFFFVAGVLVLFLKPDLIAQMTSLVSLTTVSWTGLISLYVGAQGVVDYKTTGAIAQSSQ